MTYSILDENILLKTNDNHYFTSDEWEHYEHATKEDIETFKDLRVGLFLHVGISAIGMVDMSWPMARRKMPDPGMGKISDTTYYSWAKELKFNNFNADEWISVAKNAGMKYVVVITKHHDGFHMWDTEQSDFKITNTDFKRDYIREISDACHKHGLKLGFYFSQRDWYHDDYEPVDPTKAVAIKNSPFFKMKEGEVFSITEKHKKYIEYMHKALIELMTNYGQIDILWWDSAWVGGMFLPEMWDSATIESKIRKLQPHIVINNRASLVGDYDTPEGYVGMCQTYRPWETCMTLGPKWAWTDEKPKSLKILIRQLVSAACGDGNYLLSIGCKPDGALAMRDTARLKELGDWLNNYGESIYNTRAGMIKPNAKLGSTQTSKALYIHLFKGSSVNITNPDDYDIPKIALTGEKIIVSNKNGITHIKVKRQLGSIDTIIKLIKKL